MGKVLKRDSPGYKLVFICDGAKWLWDYIDACYPNSIQILDYFHCKEHVCEFAKEFFKGEDVKAQNFIDNVMESLTNKEVEKALDKIRLLQPGTKAKQKHKGELLNYLTVNKKRIDYGTFFEMGLLIGPGAIEAAHRNVIQKRLKLSGQRWTIPGAQQAINLRICERSNQWDKVLSMINHKMV